MSKRERIYTSRENSFDHLAQGLAAGTLSRRKALRLMGAALVGGALASFPGAAWAARGGNSACARYCSTLFPEGSASHEECVSQGTRRTGPCFACGGPGNPGPTCRPNERLNTTICRCVPTTYVFCTCNDVSLPSVEACAAVDCESEVFDFCAFQCQGGQMFICTPNGC